MWFYEYFLEYIMLSRNNVWINVLQNIDKVTMNINTYVHEYASVVHNKREMAQSPG